MGEHKNKAKGEFKQTAGKVANDEKMKREGQRDEAKGRAQGAGKDVKHAAKDMKDSAKKSARR